MKFTITGRKIAVTEGMREKITKKIGKLEKFFNVEPEANIIVWTQKDRQYIEATIYAADMIYRAVENDEDLYVAIDRIIDIIERQIRKNKTRLEKNIKKEALSDRLIIGGDIFNTADEDNEEFTIVKRKQFSFKPMSVEEAILQMNLLGHQFFVFSNDQTDAMTVVYKRKDGNYGLIEQG